MKMTIQVPKWEVVNIQLQDKVTTSALSNLPLSQVYIYFPIRYPDVEYNKIGVD